MQKHVSVGSNAIATIQGSGGSARNLFSHADHLSGANVVTNSSGAVEERLEYLPFGSIRADSKSGSFSEQRKFTGHEFDDKSGYSYMQARYYDSNIGRFLNVDPAFRELSFKLEDPHTQNSYSYAKNNPLIYVDPDGREPITFMIGAGIVLTAAASLSVQVPLWWQGTTAPTHQESQQYFQMQQAAGWMTVAALEAQAPAVMIAAGGMSAKTATNSTSVKDQRTVTLKQNQANGRAYETEKLAERQKLYPETQPQITLRTGSGVRTRVDIMSRTNNGGICVIECKSSPTARLTNNQSRAFPEIERSGATDVGQGKPGFPGGMSIPPTKVRIERPQ